MENSARKRCFIFLLIMLTNISISEPKSIDGIMKMLKTLETFENIETVETFAAFETFDILKTLKTLNNIVNNHCPSHYSRYANGCYFYYDSIHKQWDSARLNCQATGGDLATSMVDNLPMFSEIYGGVLSLSPWYGAYRDGDDILFVNGTVLPANSSLWEEGYPVKKDGSPSTGNCVLFNGSINKLRTAVCITSRYFFCQAGV